MEEYLQYVKLHGLPKPSEDQVNWHAMEIGALICIGLNTFHNKEWGDGTLPPASFNPTCLDCFQWLQIAKEFGAKYAILVAKHHDGFCLWPTKTTNYSVRASPHKNGQGDVVREFIEACKQLDMKIGIYLSPWDRHEPCYPDAAPYDDFYCQQLEELMTWYDTDFVEFWFDGAGSEGRKYDWNRIMALVQKYHPHAMIFNMGRPTIRWVGNERGFANDPNWNVLQIGDTIDDTDTTDIIGVGLKINECDGYGNTWLPAECDVPLYNHQWYWHTNSERKIYPLKKLLWMYENSVGRGANLLIGMAPNRQGLMGKKEVQRMQAFGQVIKRYNLENALYQTRGEGTEIECCLPGPVRANYLMLQEDIREGQAIRGYTVMYKKSSAAKWQVLQRGTSIGYKKIDRFRTTTIHGLRILVPSSLVSPKMKTIALFRI
jgi:alpha-L-fucosidase